MCNCCGTPEIVKCLSHVDIVICSMWCTGAHGVVIFTICDDSSLICNVYGQFKGSPCNWSPVHTTDVVMDTADENLIWITSVSFSNMLCLRLGVAVNTFSCNLHVRNVWMLCNYNIIFYDQHYFNLASIKYENILWYSVFHWISDLFFCSSLLPLLIQPWADLWNIWQWDCHDESCLQRTLS